MWLCTLCSRKFTNVLIKFFTDREDYENNRATSNGGRNVHRDYRNPETIKLQPVGGCHRRCFSVCAAFRRIGDVWHALKVLPAVLPNRAAHLSPCDAPRGCPATCFGSRTPLSAAILTDARRFFSCSFGLGGGIASRIQRQQNRGVAILVVARRRQHFIALKRGGWHRAIVFQHRMQHLARGL